MNALIQSLEGVRERSDGQYYAKCPAHEDRSPSLSVKLVGDGTVLIHCFGGCEALDVLRAVGLEWSDLFPEKFEAQPQRHRHNPADLLKLVTHESTFLLLCAQHMAKGDPLLAADVERLQESFKKLHAVRDAL